MKPRVSGWPQRLLLLPSSLFTMILNLLLPILVLGFVESQTTNTTEKLREIYGNETFIVSTADYSLVKPGNMTSSLSEDEKTQIERLNNQTFIHEDDEAFQDQELMFAGTHCQLNFLKKYSQFCGEQFHMEMESISRESWCTFTDIIRPYNTMAECLEQGSTQLLCYYPNPVIHDFLLEIHSQFFQNCSNKEPLLMDPPPAVLIAITLIPISLIPLLVYRVVWKSKVHE